MPFPLLPTVLGISFVLIWAFIGAMVVRDSQLAARRESGSEGRILPLLPLRPDLPPTRAGAAFVKCRQPSAARPTPVRVAS